MVNAVDMATILNGSNALNLFNQGIRYVGRYLPTQAWKGITTAEVSAIQAAGLQLWSIYEYGGTNAGYFNAAQAIADAAHASDLAKGIGQPEGSAIYFAIDYNAPAGDFSTINVYFQQLKKSLTDYKVGVYGHFGVLNFIHDNGGVDYYWQTYAWSGGQHCTFNHLMQFQNGQNVAGIQVDYDNIENQNFGYWGQPQTAAAQTQPAQFIMTVKVLVQTDVRSDASHTSGYIKDAMPGEIYNVIEQIGDWKHVALNDQETGWIDGNGGNNLYWLDNPALTAQPAQPVYYIVKSGDTVSKIAAANKTTIAQIVSWNGLSDPNKIYVFQKLRVK